MSDFLLRRWPILLLLLLPLVPLHRMFAGEVVGPFGQIASMAPWSQPAPASSWDILQADGVLQFYAWRDMVFQGWRSFDPPFWNPYSLMGTPLLANSQSGALYPLHILAGLLHLPTGLAINLLAWIHLSMAGLGVYALCRQLGAGRHGAVFAGGSLVLSTFLLAWLPLASVGTTCAWIPWALFFAARCFDKEARLGPSMAGLAGSIGLMVLGGHLQFAFYGIGGVVVLCAVLAVQALADRTLTWRAPAACAAGAALGMMLAAPQLMPVLEYSKFSHRQAPATAQGYEGYVRNALAPWELPGLVFPSLMGFPGERSPAFEDDVLPAFWPAFVRPGAAFAESAWGVGPLLLGLLALLRRDRLRRAAAPLVLAGFALLMAMGTPLNAVFYFGVPGWSATGSPGRVIVLLVVALAVLAGILWPGTDEPEPEKDSQSLLKPGLIGIGAAALGGIVLLSAMQGGLNSWAPGMQPGVLASKQLVAGLPLALVSAALAAAALVLCLRRLPAWGLAAGLASQAALGTALFVPFGVPPFAAPSEPAGQGGQAQFERTAYINPDWGFLQTPKAVMPPNTAAAQRLMEAGGYDSLLHRDTVALLNEINGQDSAPQTNGNIMHIKPGASAAKLADAGATKVVFREGSEGPMLDVEPLGETTDNGLVTMTLPGAGLVEGGRLLRAGFSSLVVEPSGQETTIKVRRMDGWSGPAPLKQEGPWLAFQAPPGASQVELRYEPPGLRTGLGLFAAALLAVLAALLFRSKIGAGSSENPPA